MEARGTIRCTYFVFVCFLLLFSVCLALKTGFLELRT